MTQRALGIRWTIGDVSDLGFEGLRLSICGAFRLFGERAAYIVCVNTVPLALARAQTGELPTPVAWRDTTECVPEFLRPHFDRGMAEGVGWKLAPLRCFPGRFELALDNDCILWSLPESMRHWLELPASTDVCLVAEDVKACFGRFSDLCGSAPRNLGIRGLPPAFELEPALQQVLACHPGTLNSELDEQGLQLSALSWRAEPRVVSVEDVSICSPFPPHVRRLGLCGAHFCGLNAKRLAWEFEGRPAVEIIREHWQHHRARLHHYLALPVT